MILLPSLTEILIYMENNEWWKNKINFKKHRI